MADALVVEVTRPAAESVVARIAAPVEEASGTEARTQLFIDRIERRYSLGMVTVTVVLLVVPLMFGDALRPTPLRAMTFVIVASPLRGGAGHHAALSGGRRQLRTPRGAGQVGGCHGTAMEQLGQASQVAFGKTGTLTRAAPASRPSMCSTVGSARRRC